MSWETEHQAYVPYVRPGEGLDDEWPTENVGARTTMRGVDWGLLDEFELWASVMQEIDLVHCSGHNHRVAEWQSAPTIADLMLAVEEHMKVCGK